MAKRLVIAWLVAACSSFGTVQAQTCVPSPLGAASDYSVFIFGGTTLLTTTTLEGRIASGADSTLTNVEVGTVLSGAPSGVETLVVGGNLIYDGGTVHGGDVTWGLSSQLTNVSIPDGVSRQATPVDFAGEQAALLELSDFLAAQPVTGQAQIVPGTFSSTLVLNGSEPELEIFRVQMSELQTVTQVDLQVAPGASVVVDVQEDNVSIARMVPLVWTGVPAGRLTVNFAATTGLDLVPWAFKGTFVLAPRAAAQIGENLFGVSPEFDGTLVAASVSGVGSLGWEPFVGCLPVPGNEPPTVHIDSPLDGALVRTPELLVSGPVMDDQGPVTVEVNGRPAKVEDHRFTGLVTLGEGTQDVTAVASDGDLSTMDTIQLTLDSVAPDLEVTEPLAGTVVNDEMLDVRGRVQDENAPVEVSVTGQTVALDPSGDFAATVTLAPGSNSIEVRAADPAGNSSVVTRSVERFDVPSLVILAPQPLELVTESTVTMSGTVSDPTAQVTIEGLPAPVAADGSFSLAEVPVSPGRARLEARATTSLGAMVTTGVTVLRDTTAPRIVLEPGIEGAVTQEAQIRITGRLLDLGADAGLPGAEVTVNGEPVTLVADGFTTTVPLALGTNPVTIEARDASGNLGQLQTVVTRQEASGSRLILRAGDGQSGGVGSELTLALQVEARDAADQPLVDQPVVFAVAGNDGVLKDIDTGAEGRRRVVHTDQAGLVAVRFRLGSRAGIQEVRASSPGIGEVGFTAIAEAGIPAQIFVDGGGVQTGQTTAPTPELLSAVVTDAQANRLANVPVTFRVVRGDGHLGSQSSESVVFTDGAGCASTPFVLGSEQGAAAHVVEATFGARTDGVATFVASALTAGDPEDTVIQGVVFDNADQSLPGVTVSLEGSPLTAQTDARGAFRFEGAPVGHQHLHVDGSTTTRPGTWPTLEFELTTIPGQINELERPVYLLPLEVERGLSVDSTTGGVLELPEVPDFALAVAPGSVTFPDGGSEGVISVTLVHADKVPMVPNFGRQPRLVITVQPGGAIFDPPARLTVPNTDGLAPGQSVELFSFDHDQGRFITIGTGTVSDDGTAIVSDPGVGIVKAGWHASAPPAPAGTPHDCPPGCQTADGSQCIPGCSLSTGDPSSPTALESMTGCTCTQADLPPCQINPRCENGRCVGDRVTIDAIDGNCVAARNTPTTFTVQTNAPSFIEWLANGADPDSGEGAIFTTKWSGLERQTVIALCRGGANKSKEIFVGEDCASIESELIIDEQFIPFVFTFVFGRVRDRAKASFEGCVDAGMWCFRLSRFQVIIRIHVASASDTGRTELTGPDDPQITATNCADVIDDLTPKKKYASDSTGNVPRPLEGHYHLPQITFRHEKQHAEELLSLVYMPGFTHAEEFAARQKHCTECFSQIPGSLQQEVQDDIRRRTIDDYGVGPESEGRAYEQDRGLYETFVEAVRERARTQGWPSECQ